MQWFADHVFTVLILLICAGLLSAYSTPGIAPPPKKPPDEPPRTAFEPWMAGSYYTAPKFDTRCVIETTSFFSEDREFVKTPWDCKNTQELHEYLRAKYGEPPWHSKNMYPIDELAYKMMKDQYGRTLHSMHHAIPAAPRVMPRDRLKSADCAGCGAPITLNALRLCEYCMRRYDDI